MSTQPATQPVTTQPLANQRLAEALRRVESVMNRRPSAGLQPNFAATAVWRGGTRVETRAANGASVLTDMSTEFGGSGDQFTPGWLFRAGLASCTATSIAMTAALQGIELSLLEITTSSRSDARGVLGMAEADGTPVYAGMRDVELRVRIAAAGASPAQLRALVEGSRGNSPMFVAMEDAVPVALRIEIETG